MSGEHLYLGIDAGGTHCRSRLVDGTGAILGTGIAGPANAGIGMEALRETLLDVCRQAVAEAGLSDDRAATVRLGVGLAGISRPGVREALDALALPFGEARFDSDAAIANLGAHGGEDGAILILGTGSIAFVAIGGESFTIGGYGFPISDEGSGAALGLSAVRHALRALDGRSERTPLASAITARFNHNITKVIGWMAEAKPREYASFAPLVMERAEENDPIARSIVEDASLHIERFIETIFQHGAPRLALMGGLAPHMRPWLRARIVARLSEPKGDALDGALLLAGLNL